MIKAAHLKVALICLTLQAQLSISEKNELKKTIKWDGIVEEPSCLLTSSGIEMHETQWKCMARNKDLQYAINKTKSKWYLQQKAMFQITINRIYWVHMKMGCIITTASTKVIHIKQELTLYAGNPISLVNNIQFTGADNMHACGTCRCGYLHYFMFRLSSSPNFSRGAPERRWCDGVIRQRQFFSMWLILWKKCFLHMSPTRGG